MKCDFELFVPYISCDPKSSRFNGIFNLIDRDKDTDILLNQLNVLTKNVLKEFDLILMRACIEPNIEKFKLFKICANHREKLGIINIYYF